MNKSQRKERLERRRNHVHLLKQQLKQDLAETNGDAKLMQDRGYLFTGFEGKWRRMTKTERKMFSDAERS